MVVFTANYLPTPTENSKEEMVAGIMRRRTTTMLPSRPVTFLSVWRMAHR